MNAEIAVLSPAVLGACMFAFCGCLTSGAGREAMVENFGDDVLFLKRHTDAFVLRDPASKAMVAIVPGMQARVMTSSADGNEGPSCGWINRKLIESGKRQAHINVFGGEDRIWLGPEGGQYSIFFKKGDPFDLEHWHTPGAIDWGGWDLAAKKENQAIFRKAFSIENYFGFKFRIEAERTIRVLDRAGIEQRLETALASGVKSVGCETVNSIKNAGKEAWTKRTGLLSIWILGMLKHSPSTVVVIPFKPGPESELGPMLNDSYFGKVPADRLKVDPRGVIFFKCDGKYRSKIGVSPLRARDVMGSYSGGDGVLTIVKFTLPGNTRDYVNSMWEIQKEPYGGDAVNSYNDGPPAPGQPPLGPFYEIESSSPAAALGAGENAVHVHGTFHFTGPKPELDRLAKAILGVGLNEIEAAF